MNGFEALLAPERSWLALQPEFRGEWERGLNWFERIVRTSAYEYVQDYAEGAHHDQFITICRSPIASAILYHWRSAWKFATDAETSTTTQTTRRHGEVSGEWVVVTLRDGKRPTTPAAVATTPRYMGGDPLRDLVLTVLALAGADRALHRLYQEYRGVFDAEARLLLGHGTPPAEWEDLVSRLLFPRSGRRPEPPLSYYRGYGSLRHWLRPVVRNFLRDLWRRMESRRSAEWHFAEQNAARPSPLRDAAELGIAGQSGRPFEPLRVPLQRAFGRLDPEDRDILVMTYVCELPNVAVARKLGVVPGHASRLKQKALLRLQGVLTEVLLCPSQGEPPVEDGERWNQLLSRLSPPALGELVRILSDVLEFGSVE